MQNSFVGPPLRHHFLPEFYLKQWAQEDGRFVEYKKPYGDKVKPRKTHPKATGFIFRLYAFEGLADDLVHEFESKFLSPVDSQAAQALYAMQADRAFSNTQRLAWASFLATLLSRMPEDMELVKKSIRELAQVVLPGFKPIFDILKPESETRTFQHLSNELMENSDQRAIEFVGRVMSSEKLVRGIAGMEWSILTLHGAKFELLTSDRPVIYTHVLGNDQSHIALPIGPRRLFLAAKDRKLINRLQESDDSALAAVVNAGVVGAAVNYVYGSNDSQLRFVQNRMGKSKVQTLMERMRDIQRDQYDLLKQQVNEMAKQEMIEDSRT